MKVSLMRLAISQTAFAAAVEERDLSVYDRIEGVG